MEKRRVLFIDSADPEEIKKALDDGWRGVTTNPSLVAKNPSAEGKDFMEKYLNHMGKIVQVCRDDKYLRDKKYPSLSVEVFSLEPAEMIEQARYISGALGYKNLAIKIPISYRVDGKTKNFLPVIKTLASHNFNINATCGFVAGQLELAAQAGARFVSLFYNRLIDYNASEMGKDIGTDAQVRPIEEVRNLAREKALQELRDTRRFLDNSSLDCEIILGSIRTSYDVTDGWKNGADIVTAGYKVAPGLLYHAGTDASVKGFDNELKAWLAK